MAAHLEQFAVDILVSENRHFLQEIPDLPFQTLSAAEALVALDEPANDAT